MTDFADSTKRFVPDQIPNPFGRYEVLGQLGQGGMGVVFRAWDPALEREVALKIPLNIDPSDAALLERFQREARAAAALHHPNICSVFDVGEADGIPYFTLQFIRGEPLSELIRREGYLLPERAAELCLKIAGALQHAHENGILHRDLKPSNVMLDYAGNPHVMDFGLSRRIDQSDAALTEAGQMLGTPAYMAPEQVRGDLDQIGPATDLYGLGTILYEMLTGRRPFSSSGPRVLVDVLSTNPPPVSDLRPEIDPRLDDICSRALAKEIDERFSSAAEMQHALESCLADVSRTAATRRLIPPTTAFKGIAATLLLVVVLLLVLRRDPAKPEIGPAGTGDARAASVAPPGRVAEGAADSPSSGALDGKDVDVSGASSIPASIESFNAAVNSRLQRSEDFADTSREADPVDRSAVAVLRRLCHSCHGLEFSVPRLDVLDRSALLAAGEDGALPYVTPDRPEHSLLWQRVGVDGDMPPEHAEQPTAAERELLRRWIESGARFPQGATRQFLSWADQLTSVRDDLRSAPVADRRFLRYFTLTNLSNDSSVTRATLAESRAALSKALNSLSWSAEIVVPRAVDGSRTIFAIDLRDFGWHKGEVWERVTGEYPYGLAFRQIASDQLESIAVEVYELAGHSLPAVRADWFIATATRPPLYETLLRLPPDVDQLEQQLAVDTRNDFLHDRLARAGFSESGVSSQNRLVDRHVSQYGVYWKSYDFRTNDGRGSIFRFPLGPDFAGHPHARQAFQHDGGEMIFSLPNGLHGYFLADAQGQRIAAGPVEIVSDSLATSGTAAIVNGLSCMGCHRAGTIELVDRLGQGAAVFGSVRTKLEALVPSDEELKLLLRKDRERYLDALELAIGPLVESLDRSRPPEPISGVVRRYQQDLDLDDAARELNLPDPSLLEMQIRNSRHLQVLGLGPLLDGGRLDRSMWSSLAGLISPFQQTAKELDLGTPLHSN